MLTAQEDVYGVGAFSGGAAKGSNFIEMWDEAAGIGPVSVDVSSQGEGIGRKTMEHVIARGRAQGFEMIRLVQDSFNMRSLALYASLGFDTKEPVALMQPMPAEAPDNTVRAITEDDLGVIDELSRRIYKVSRANEVTSSIHGPFRPFLRERDGHVTGYYVVGIAGHGVAETEEDLLALVREATRQAPAEFQRVLCPLTEGSLYRKFLAAGCRNIKVMNLMALGPYERPDGAWAPSVLF